MLAQCGGALAAYLGFREGLGWLESNLSENGLDKEYILGSGLAADYGSYLKK
jgi:hypothetical protein